MASTMVMEFTDRVFLANYSLESIAAALPAGIAAYLFPFLPEPPVTSMCLLPSIRAPAL
jgi:uncharacterized protein (DUF2062 family)